MRPVPIERFRSLFGSLDAPERREFVADLYAARGWEVRSDEGVIHASREGRGRRIAVLDPPRFGSVSLPDVDTAVVTRDDEDHREAAEDAGVEYLAPADVRDLLLYGLDRETAAPLFEEYFDRPLSTAKPAPTDAEDSARIAVLSSLDGNAGRLSVVAAFLLVVGALVTGAGTLPTDDPEPTVPDPTTTYTPGEAGALGGNETYPPGIGEKGVENSGELALAHLEYLSNRTYAYRIGGSGPQHAMFMQGHSSWEATVFVEDQTTYRYKKRAVAPHGYRVEQREDNRTVWVPKRPSDPNNESTSDTLIKEVYANGTAKFWRFNDTERVVYRRATVDQQGGRVFAIVDQAGWPELYIQRFLWTENSSVRCLSETETDDCRTYRVEATGQPVEVRADLMEYRAVAEVEQSGFVRSLRVRYSIELLGETNETATVRFRMEYGRIGNVSVSPPEWLDTAKNRIEDTRNAGTVTPTDATNETATEGE